MFNRDAPEVHFALNAVRRATCLVKQVQAEMVSPALVKEDRSPVTVADFASQAVVGRMLASAFPDEPLVAEEDSLALRQSGEGHTLEQVVHFVSYAEPDATPERVCGWIDRGAGEPTRRFWTLDPIDGTKGFLRGDQYAVALALVVDGQVQIGVLGCPNLVDGYRPELGGLGSLALAVRGGGAWVSSLDGKMEERHALRISQNSAPARARLLRSFESGHTNVSQVDHLADILGVKAEPVRMDSQAKYLLLAAGAGELYMRMLSPKQPDYREKIWDQAAGSLLVEEAGGQVTDLDGKPLDFSTGRVLSHNRGILASNGLLHAAALQTLRILRA